MVLKNPVFYIIIILLSVSTLCPLAGSLGQEPGGPNSVAVSMTKNGTYEEAIVHYDKILETEPGNIPALDNKGSTLFLMGEYTKASDIYDRILSIRPDSPAALFKKALCLSAQDEHEKALEYYNRSLYLLENKSILDYEPFFDIGLLSLTDDPVPYDGEDTGYDPRFPSLWYHKARSLDATGRNNESLYYYDLIIDLADSRANELSVRASGLYELGRYNESIDIYEEA